MSDNNTITRGELAAALDALNAEPLRRGAAILSLGDPSAVTGEIFAAAQRNREPEYEPYEIYEAGDGKRWEFYADEGGEQGWLLPGQATKYAFGFPARPLRKMVPEPAKPDSEAIAEEIFQGFRSNRTPDEMAERICARLTASEETCPGGC